MWMMSVVCCFNPHISQMLECSMQLHLSVRDSSRDSARDVGYCKRRPDGSRIGVD